MDGLTRLDILSLQLEFCIQQGNFQTLRSSQLSIGDKQISYLQTPFYISYTLQATEKCCYKSLSRTNVSHLEKNTVTINSQYSVQFCKKIVVHQKRKMYLFQGVDDGDVLCGRQILILSLIRASSFYFIVPRGGERAVLQQFQFQETTLKSVQTFTASCEVEVAQVQTQKRRRCLSLVFSVVPQLVTKLVSLIFFSCQIFRLERRGNYFSL